jgi:prepilin-type processing-associated H-X9-DG protein
MELGQIAIYRMIHIENIPHILKFGLTHKTSSNSNPGFITIGDISLIDTRSAKKVVVDNGDPNYEDTKTIILGDFIPFYFGIKMPMLYVIQNGGNFVERATPAKDIVYLACRVTNIIRSSANYYFCDGHATDNLTTFYDKTKIHQLPDIIDWNAVRASYWGGQENLNIKRKKQAEFLVGGDLPPDYLIGFICYDEVSKQKLLRIGIKEEKIQVLPRAYY